MTANPPSPHGGALVDLVVEPARRKELMAAALTWPSWRLSPRQMFDLELLASGAFSPLQTFLGSEDYAAVCHSMRLADGTLWPMPITLDVPEPVVRMAESAGMLALRDSEGALVAALHLSEAWRPDRPAEAASVLGTTNDAHPGVEHLLHRTNDWYVSGRIEVLEPFRHPDFSALRYTPAQLRNEFRTRGWERVVAFNTRNPMHRAHLELTLRGAREADAKLLVHPVVGLTQRGDIDYDTRVRCYRALLPSYPADTAMLSLLPLAMRMAGPREALWHALIRKNHGATHFIVGRDHAGPRADTTGRPWYHPYAAQELLKTHEAELGITIIPFRRMVYLSGADSYVEEHEAPSGVPVLQISGTEMRERLATGVQLPEWFTVPAVAEVMQRRFRPRHDQGITVFFTGLSGSGKSTIAKSLAVRLRDHGDRSVSVLDGDEVRRRLSSELSYSPLDRERHVLRIGYVAAELTKSGGAAICARVAPSASSRREIRRLVEDYGGFVLVHVNTPLEVCQARDRKGLYAKAKAGLVEHFPGISDGYEVPTDADVVIDTTAQTPDQAAEAIMEELTERGYLRPMSS
jgi:sulfate adenylyltransferase